MTFFKSSATTITDTELANQVTDCTIKDDCFKPTTSSLDWLLNNDSHPAPDFSLMIKAGSQKFIIQPDVMGAWWENSVNQSSINFIEIPGSINWLSLD